MYDAEMTDVDNIRLIKTNKSFYRRLICLWIKFRAVQTVDHLSKKSESQQIMDLQNYVQAKMHLGKQA